jgi:hypothetical protein
MLIMKKIHNFILPKSRSDPPYFSYGYQIGVVKVWTSECSVFKLQFCTLYQEKLVVKSEVYWDILLINYCRNMYIMCSIHVCV